MIDLLKDENGYTTFLINIEPDIEYSMTFEVFEVAGWECDEQHTPIDLELYMTGFIKWDGCSHVWFGEKEEDQKQDGYLHLCGKAQWDKHCKMMMAVYDLAERTITKYDPDIGS